MKSIGDRDNFAVRILLFMSVNMLIEVVVVMLDLTCCTVTHMACMDVPIRKENSSIRENENSTKTCDNGCFVSTKFFIVPQRLQSYCY